MNILDDLAVKYNIDKSSKKLHHNYTKYYNRYFEGRRREVKSILEIGVCTGGSLKMWKEYFPNATVYGIDIQKDCKRLEEDRVKIFIGDQSNKDFLKTVVDSSGGNFDIVIDDGSHYSSHQISSFVYLFPFVKSQGHYIIEDLNTSYWPKYGGGVKKSGTCVEFLKDRIDDIYFNGYRYQNSRNILRTELVLSDKKDLNDFERNLESMHFYNGMMVALRR